MSVSVQVFNQPQKKPSGKDPVRWVAWPALSGVVFLAVGLLILKYYEDGMRARERGRLVSSIVDQQFRQLSAGFAKDGVDSVELATADLSDESPELRQWLVQESFKADVTPADLAARLDALEREPGRGRALSPLMRQSLRRWKSALLEWNSELGDRGTGDAILEKARRVYFEAAGYQKIGRAYDATVLHLWTISLLTRFVGHDPFASRIPEVLYMLGVAYLNLGHALPPQMRRDRILNLCGELYPDSIWAARSNLIWSEVFADAG